MNDIPFFIGGSRRFGYYRTLSDVDVFVLPKVRQIPFIQELEHMGFKPTGKTTMYPADPFCFKNLIHIVVFPDEGEFSSLKLDHEKVESWLLRNPQFVDFARIIQKDFGVKGSILFRTFLKLAHKS